MDDRPHRATDAWPGSVILMGRSRGTTATALPAINRHDKPRRIRLAALDGVLEP